jgi:acylphosphatase
MRSRLHLIVHGRVQGVFFRASARASATHLGLTGWVKNRPDGTVEILAEGLKDKLVQLLEWSRHGPPQAQVARVEERWADFSGAFPAFAVMHD